MRALPCFAVLVLAALTTLSGGCGSADCDRPMEGSVYCQEWYGENPVTPAPVTLDADRLVVRVGKNYSRLTAPNHLESLFVEGPERWDPVRAPQGRLCWEERTGIPDDRLHIHCGPTSGGSESTWLTGRSGAVPAVLAAIPNTREAVVAYVHSGKDEHTELFRADVNGKLAKLGDFAGTAQDAVVLGSDVFAQVGGAVLKVPLDGSVSFEVLRPKYGCRLYRVDDAVYCGGFGYDYTGYEFSPPSASEFMKVAPGVPSAPALFQAPGEVVQATDTMIVSLEPHRVTEIAANGTVKRTLWQRPFDYDGETVRSVIVDGRDLIVHLYQSRCVTSGRDKQSSTTCTDVANRVELVRVRF